MNEITPYFFENAPHYHEDALYFNHENLESLRWEISSLIDSVEESLSLLCKTDVDINLVKISSYQKGTKRPFENSHIGIKLVQISSGISIIIFMPVRLIREIITSFLNADFSKKDLWAPFSSTEKGILAFIVSQLLFDLEKLKPEWMNSLVIDNIFSSKDPSVVIDDHSQMAIDIAFSHKHHQFSGRILAPRFQMPCRDLSVDTSDLLGMARHLISPFCVVLKECLIPINVLRKLSIGDIIIFDSCALKMIEGGLLGKIHASFEHLLLWVNIIHENGCYVAVIEGVAKPEEVSMKSVDIAEEIDATNLEDPANDLSQEIASSIRVPLSVEIASVPLSLKKICQLKKDDIIDLNRKITDPLNLVIDKKVIGQAMPIQIGDRLGIKITMINAYEN